MEQQVPQQPAPHHQPPQQQFHQQPAAPQSNPGQVWGIIALVLGILSILISCVSVSLLWWVGLPMAIGSLVCGIVGRTKTPVGMKSGMAIAGIVLGSVGIVVGIIAMIIFLIALGDATSSPEFYDLMRQLEAY